jgi:hypothetical protein
MSTTAFKQFLCAGLHNQKVVLVVAKLRLRLARKRTFIATELLRVTNGRITDNWHFEDSLTLLTQMGAVKVEQ